MTEEEKSGWLHVDVTLPDGQVERHSISSLLGVAYLLEDGIDEDGKATFAEVAVMDADTDERLFAVHNAEEAWERIDEINDGLGFKLYGHCSIDPKKIMAGEGIDWGRPAFTRREMENLAELYQDLKSAGVFRDDREDER